MLYYPTAEESKILCEIKNNEKISFKELKEKFNSETFEKAFEGCIQKSFVKVENGIVVLTENGEKTI